MSVFLCLPSARPPAECEPVFQRWKEQGYMLAIQRDPGQLYHSPSVDMMFERPYKGYPEAVNWLAKMVLRHRDTDWIVAAGDDTLPDPNHTAEDIAAQLTAHFGGTMGCCQFTGDRWGDNAYSRARWPEAPAMIDRICGSPWLSREFCLRINQGEGPLWREYHHNWADEELQNVAIKYDCFWQRRDLIHYHEHALRNGGNWQAHQQGFSGDYKRMEPLFRARKAAGFPGSEPL